MGIFTNWKFPKGNPIAQAIAQWGRISKGNPIAQAIAQWGKSHCALIFKKKISLLSSDCQIQFNY